MGVTQKWHHLVVDTTIITTSCAAMSNILGRVGARGYRGIAKFGRVVKPRFDKFTSLARVEMAAPSRAEFMAEMSKLKEADIAGMPSRFANITLNEIGARGLVVLEVALWFYVGEIIGRGSIVGYNPSV